MLLRWISVALCVLAAAAGAQDAGTLEGTVRDSQGRPTAAATVYLQPKAMGQTLRANTDTTGTYRFAGLRAGDYLLRAEGGTARPVTLGDRESKKANLTVDYAFFDDPNFIVAGVTDPVSRGGHGSDTVLRSSEALAKATAELGAAEGPGDALKAVREYQRAAELNPSEPNLFNWGSELLVHRTAEPATEVFAKGHRLFPHSLRLLLGLAAAWYARGDYEQASRSFFEACDLNPSDPRPYMFLGKIQSIEIVRLPGYAERLERFAKLHPDNAWANYYYAVGLWKQRKSSDDSETPARVREVLEKAVHLDPRMGAAYLQLGILYSERNDGAKAIAAYQRAIEVSPEMDEPHYRLGQAYERNGQKERGRQELEIYERMSRKLQQDMERQRSETRQFVIELRDGTPAASPR